METQALELWGNMFLNAARGQKFVEDFTHAMRGDPGSFGDLFEMYGKWWGMDFLFPDLPGYFNAYLKALGEFQNTFMGGFLSLMSGPWSVPGQSDYQSLLKECDDLRETVQRQEEEIARLRAALGEGLSLQDQSVSAFQNLMKKQTQQFQDMMGSLSKIFQAATGSGEEGKDLESAEKKSQRSRRKS